MLIKRNIKICLGSSCFARGNSELISEVQKFIRIHSIEDKVNFTGEHCFHNCSEGPNMNIEGRIFNNISKENISEILKHELSDLL